MDYTLFFYSARSALLPAERVRRAAGEYTGRQDSYVLAKESGGKPFFLDEAGLYLSISHSGALWVCAVGAAPVGVDLQIHKDGTERERLSRRFFHPEEDLYLAAQNYQGFFDIWAAKESYVKLTGQGIDGDYGSFSVAGPSGFRKKVRNAQLALLPFMREYSLCLCAQRIDTIRILFPGWDEGINEEKSGN